nr:putative E3 ubiquitin-protein ligase makorin-1 [Biomphalaria glabrata]
MNNATQNSQSVYFKVCPHNETGDCAKDCPYLHGSICTICGIQRLNPLDPAQHYDACKQRHVETSKDMTCSICFEKVKEISTNSYFAIQENCNHCFCFNCLGLWQNNTAMANNEACPVCRTPSGYVINYEYWVTCPKSKRALIAEVQRLEKEEPNYFEIE